MRNPARLLALLLVSLLALTGCVRTDADLFVDAQDRVSGDLFMGVDPNRVPEPQRSQLRDLIEQKIQSTTWPDGVTARYVVRGDYAGGQLTFQDVPLPEYRDAVEQAYDAAGISGSGYPEFVRRGDVYDMNWQTRIQSDQVQRPDEVNAAVAFPGEVLQSNGTVPKQNRNTAQWSPAEADSLPALQASGSAIPNGALLKPFDTLVRGLVFIALLALAGLMLWVVWWNVKRRRSAESSRT